MRLFQENRRGWLLRHYSICIHGDIWILYGRSISSRESTPVCQTRPSINEASRYSRAEYCFRELSTHDAHHRSEYSWMLFQKHHQIYGTTTLQIWSLWYLQMHLWRDSKDQAALSQPSEEPLSANNSIWPGLQRYLVLHSSFPRPNWWSKS